MRPQDEINRMRNRFAKEADTYPDDTEPQAILDALTWVADRGVGDDLLTDYLFDEGETDAS